MKEDKFVFGRWSPCFGAFLSKVYISAFNLYPSNYLDSRLESFYQFDKLMEGMKWDGR